MDKQDIKNSDNASRKRSKKNFNARIDELKKAYQSPKFKKGFQAACLLAELALGKGRGPKKRKLALLLLNTAFELPEINQATELWVLDWSIGAALKAIGLVKKSK